LRVGGGEKGKRLSHARREKLLLGVRLGFFIPEYVCTLEKESKHRFIHVLCGVGQKYSNAAAAAPTRALTSSFFSRAHTAKK